MERPDEPGAVVATPTREQIEHLEGILLQMEGQGAGVAIDTWHHFADGLVVRTILIPAGTMLTGAAHKAEHLNIAHGDITVWTEAGMRRLTGYHVLPSLPGAKRVGYAHADTWWTTVHLNPTNERDLDRIEDELVEDAHMLQRRRAPALSDARPAALALPDQLAGIDDARADYPRFLAEFEFDHDAVRRVVENDADRVPMPAGFDKVCVGVSAIDGQGLIAVAPIEAGETIAPARLQDHRTPAGRFTNHSPRPNARMAPAAGGDLHLVAERAIGPGDEVTIDYRQAGSVNGWGMRPNLAECVTTVRQRLVGAREVVDLPDAEIEAAVVVMLARFGFLPAPEVVRAFMLQWCSAKEE